MTLGTHDAESSAEDSMMSLSAMGTTQMSPMSTMGPTVMGAFRPPASPYPVQNFPASDPLRQVTQQTQPVVTPYYSAGKQ